MGVNSLPKTVTRQRRGCDLYPGPSAPESSTLTTRLPSHPTDESSTCIIDYPQTGWVQGHVTSDVWENMFNLCIYMYTNDSFTGLHIQPSTVFSAPCKRAQQHALFTSQSSVTVAFHRAKFMQNSSVANSVQWIAMSASLNQVVSTQSQNGGQHLLCPKFQNDTEIDHTGIGSRFSQLLSANHLASYCGET